MPHSWHMFDIECKHGDYYWPSVTSNGMPEATRLLFQEPAAAGHINDLHYLLTFEILDYSV